MSDLNVTMVAFHGQAKPQPLQKLLLDVLGAMSASVPASLSWWFRSYDFAQMHGTMIGMEVDVTDGRLDGHWLRANKGEVREIDIDGLHSSLKSLVRPGKPLFSVRFGGFSEAYCKCKDEHPDACTQWRCESVSQSADVFHSCDRTPYEGSFYAFAPGPAMITGWPTDGPDHLDTFPHSLYEFRCSLEQCGLADSYHYHQDHIRRHWKDDDCYIRIGTFVGPAPAEQFRATENAVRSFLSNRKPVVIDLTVNDVSFVLYDDPSLLSRHVKRQVRLKEFLKNPSSVKELYDIVLNRGP